MTQPTLRELQEAISSIGCTSEKILSYVTEPDILPYGRNVIYQSNNLEAVVICIPGMRKTSVHDHGNSTGCAYVVEGSLINKLYVLEKDNKPFCYEKNKFMKGEFFYATKGQIHSMCNSSGEKLITFHVYSPPIRDMRVYGE
ncbi:cysteine dioxygenase [Paenactinomyces guangxiensis]|uniref:Cysteine dioxygenase family protein n=1 Tax=Paenactinomyces guangxiensis TaxID=1490290 RepID=A0A7W2A895_9BACL|nr:cysteine dioxygenase family protein [Paenactinomyces guangxiensis]MBA4493939.1 cysteine dioxygenase family protein [Paenactinomyces guangxiensis]MBH8591406.1 cysteine dioxygenase family protein [Paenactinomyces guangxiensis]